MMFRVSFRAKERVFFKALAAAVKENSVDHQNGGLY